jgi:hypothetical protein
MTHVFLDAKLKDAAKMSFGFATVPFCIVVDKVSGIEKSQFHSLFTSHNSLHCTALHCRAAA